jgi:hypothetical protein
MRLPECEQDLMRGIYQGLTLQGYIVLRVGQWRADHAGSDPGCPDLFVSHPAWLEACWLGLECKGTHARLSAAQRRLADGGRVVVCRRWEDALSELRRFERRLRIINQ